MRVRSGVRDPPTANTGTSSMLRSVVSRAMQRRRFAAAGVAALALAVAPSAAQAEGWVPGPRFALSYPSMGAALAVAPSGAAYATWMKIGADSRDTVFQYAAPDGTLGPVHSLPGASQTAMQGIAANDSGAAVLWERSLDGSAPAMELTLLARDGTPRTTATLDTGTDRGFGSPQVAIAPDGSVLAIWIRYGLDDDDDDAGVVKAARVSADGTVAPALTLGAGDDGLATALAPDGTGWLTWNDGVGDIQQVARVTAAGALDGAPVVLPLGPEADLPALTASAAGAVFTAEGRTNVEGVRLPLRGSLIGSTFASATQPFGYGASTLLADDGTVTIAWSVFGGDMFPSFAATYSRIAPGAATGPAQALAPGTSGIGTVLPRLAQVADGSLLTAWADARSMVGGAVATRRIGADGSRGPVLATGLDAPLAYASSVASERLLPLTATRDGGAFAASIDVGFSGTALIETAVLDVHPPQVAATLPAGGQTAQRLDFSATASDRSGVSYWWDFGDGSGARTASAAHAYASPGSYSATLTVTDGGANQTVVTRALQITAPPPPTPTPTPPANRRAAAALKLTSAVRSGRTVTVTGTIVREATGKVTLLYTQKNGRRTLTAKSSAKVAKGRFRAVIRLASSLARSFRVKPTVTAAYAGDSATTAARTVRTVTVRAARRGAKKKR